MGTATDRRLALEALLRQASAGTVNNTTGGPGFGMVRQQAFAGPDSVRTTAADTMWDKHNADARQNAINTVGPYGQALEAMRKQAEAARLAAEAARLAGRGGGGGGGGGKAKEMYEPLEFDLDDPYAFLRQWIDDNAYVAPILPGGKKPTTKPNTGRTKPVPLRGAY